MVLRLKTRESRSLPGLPNATFVFSITHAPAHADKQGSPTRPVLRHTSKRDTATSRIPDNAGWSSPVARQAHNLKAAGSNPAPATKNQTNPQKPDDPQRSSGFLRSERQRQRCWPHAGAGVNCALVETLRPDDLHSKWRHDDPFSATPALCRRTIQRNDNS